jgi:hypothetical protein
MRAIVLVLVACGSSKSTSAPAPTGAACAADTDCVISCESRDDCCHNPYCETVQPLAVVHDVEEYNREHCKTLDYKCPQVGDRSESFYNVVPRCKQGACVAEQQPTGVDVTKYDRACKTADDCKVVKVHPCDKCGCPDRAIAAGELARFTAARDAIVCAPDERQCGECRGYVAACESGRCVAHPE